MMERDITQVTLNRHIKIISDINQLPYSTFLTWLTDKDYEITKILGAVHCEIYEAFMECKFLRIGISYAKDEYTLQIFPKEDNSKSEEERIPLFSDKESSVKDISKYLSQHRRNEYFKITEQNK
jgi:hypothetical protein